MILKARPGMSFVNRADVSTLRLSFVKVFEYVHDLRVRHFLIQRPYHLLKVFDHQFLLSGIFFAFMIEVKLRVDFRIDDNILHFPDDLLGVD